MKTSLNRRLRRTKTRSVSMINVMRTFARNFDPFKIDWLGVDSVIEMKSNSISIY